VLLNMAGKFIGVFGVGVDVVDKVEVMYMDGELMVGAKERDIVWFVFTCLLRVRRGSWCWND